MALHTTLPIYRVAYQLVVLVSQLTANFPRNYKATYGGRLCDECAELVMLIFRANVETADVERRVVLLTKLVERQQLVELLLSLCVDLKLITPKQYGAAITLTSSVGKQANGWRKKPH